MRDKALKIKRYYRRNQWSERMVRDAYEKGRITADELAAIISPRTVIAALGSNPVKSELLEAADSLGVDVPDGATNAEITALLDIEAGL